MDGDDMNGIRSTLGLVEASSYGAINVTERLGLATDGSADVSAALQGLVDSLPDVRSNLAGQFPAEPGASFNSSGTATLFMPGTDRDGNPLRYRFDSEVVVPGNKAIRWTGGAAQSCTLENNSANEWIFRMDGTGNANGTVSAFDGFAFWKGGLRYEGRFRGQIETSRNIFVQTPGPAVRYVNGTDSFAPIAMTNWLNVYFQCAGAEWVEGIQAGIVGMSWRNRYLWNRDTPLVIDGTVHKVHDNDFQLMERTAAPSKCYLLLRNQDEPSAFVSIRGNRFAPEMSDGFPDGFDYSAPFAAIQAGQTADDTQVVSNINIVGNEFLGAASADTTPGIGQYGVAFFHRPVDCYIGGNNHYQNIAVAAVGEQWTGGGTLTTGGPDRNRWGTNNNATTAPTVFEHGGFAWSTDAVSTDTRTINGAFAGPVAPNDATNPQIVDAGTVTGFAVAGTITGADNVVFELANLDTPFATNPTVTLNAGNAGKAQVTGLTAPVAALDRIRAARTDANAGTTIDQVSILATLEKI